MLAAWAVEELVPKLLMHESDGLIFQGRDQIYTKGTCRSTFKWKYAKLNSVDFVLRGDEASRGSSRPGDPAELFIVVF